MNLGERLRQLRQEQNLTQPELADAMGIEQSYVSKLENGKYVPSSDVFGRILDVFKLEVADLVADLDQGTRNQLRQIPDVARYFADQKQLMIGNRRVWLFGSTLLLALGAASIYAGAAGLVVGSNIYTYESLGVVLEQESKEVFHSIFNDNFRRASGLAEDDLAPLRGRLDQRYIQTSNYRG